MTTQELAASLGLPTETNYVAPNGNNVRGAMLHTVDTLIIHETANKKRGTNARMHRKFVFEGGGPDQASFHWCVDSERAVAIVPENQIAFHAGDGATGPYAVSSLSIELCINADGDWGETQVKGAQLAAAMLRVHNRTPAALRQHHIVYGKDCPETIRHTPGAWELFCWRVSQYWNVLAKAG